jgi:hypothetical protein
MTWPGRTALLLLAALLLPSTSQALDWLEAAGYVRSFIIGIHPVQYTNGDELPDPDLLWANSTRARGNLAAFAADWLEFNVSYDMSVRLQDDDLFTQSTFLVFKAASIYRLDDLDPLVWPDDPGQGDHVAILQNLDRFYATVHAPRFDLYIGRQAIAWGSAKAVNPTDIIAPFLYNEIDTSDRIGVDAVRLRAPAGSLGEVDIGYVAGKDFKMKESAAFARWRVYALRTDAALITMAFRRHAMAGLDFTRSIGGAGSWCEAAYVWANLFGDREADSDEHDYLRLSAGADYNFGAGIYGFLEYHYNGAGAASPDDYTPNIETNLAAYQDGAVYFLGRNYLIPGVAWQATALTSIAAQLMTNLDDGSFLVAPFLEYNATDNLYLSAGGYIAIGDNPTFVSWPAPADSGNIRGLQMVFNSEFGAYPSQLYMFLHYYF